MGKGVANIQHVQHTTRRPGTPCIGEYCACVRVPCRAFARRGVDCRPSTVDPGRALGTRRGLQARAVPNAVDAGAERGVHCQGRVARQRQRRRHHRLHPATERRLIMYVLHHRLHLATERREADAGTRKTRIIASRGD